LENGDVSLEYGGDAVEEPLMNSTDPGRPERLRGLRVLVVEDEAMVSMLLEDMLDDFACEIVGPAFSLEQAKTLAMSEPGLGAAILDVNVRGTPIYPVAEILLHRGVPFVFATGYGPESLDVGWRAYPKLQKPFSSQQVAVALLTALDAKAA
jgi:DNA-binding NtrC family response regulator